MSGLGTLGRGRSAWDARPGTLGRGRSAGDARLGTLGRGRSAGKGATFAPLPGELGFETVH
jgi:hypothetical protein